MMSFVVHNNTHPFHHGSLVFDEPHVAYYRRPHYHHEVVDTHALLQAVAIEQQRRREEEHRRAMIAAARRQQQREQQIALALLRERELEIQRQRQFQRQREIQRQREQERRRLHRYQQQQALLAAAQQQRQRAIEKQLLEEQKQWADVMTAMFEDLFGLRVENDNDNEEQEVDEKQAVAGEKSETVTPAIEAPSSEPVIAPTSTAESANAPVAEFAKIHTEPKMRMYVRTFDPVNGWRIQELVYPEKSQSRSESVKEKENTTASEPQQQPTDEALTTDVQEEVKSHVEEDEVSVSSSKQGSDVTVEDVDESDESEDDEFVVM